MRMDSHPRIGQCGPSCLLGARQHQALPAFQSVPPLADAPTVLPSSELKTAMV